MANYAPLAPGQGRQWHGWDFEIVIFLVTMQSSVARCHRSKTGHFLAPLSVTAILAIRWHLWAHVCRRSWIALSSDCVIVHYDAAWQQGWLYVSWRKHVLAFTLPSQQMYELEELAGGWDLADDQTEETIGQKKLVCDQRMLLKSFH